MDKNNESICRFIQENIDKLCQTEIDEIFKILHSCNCSYTQNNNGVFVNLSWVDISILTKIKKYISFCLQSQSEISKYEQIKNTISDSLITNKDKIDTDIQRNDNDKKTTNNKQTNRISSSMKFYLLKKKFQKKSGLIINNNINNSLTYEEYLIN